MYFKKIQTTLFKFLYQTDPQISEKSGGAHILSSFKTFLIKEPTHQELQMEAVGFQLDVAGFWLESFEWASGLLQMQRKKYSENQRIGLKGCKGGR